MADLFSKYTFSEEDLKKLAYLLKSFGMQIDSLKKSHLLRRVRVRMMRTNCNTFRDYYNYAQSHEDEKNELRLAFSINVTRFFRNADTFQLIKQMVLPRIIETINTDIPIKIWSAGCADGAEAYTLAILCEQLNLHPPKVRIIATDYNHQLLMKAQQFLYPKEYLEETPPEVQRKYFVQKSDELIRISSHLRNYIDFRIHNMTLQRARAPGSGYDLILCRNVLIYFSKDQQNELFSMFHKALKPGGFLIIGRTEMIHSNWRNKFQSFDSRHRISLKI